MEEHTGGAGPGEGKLRVLHICNWYPSVLNPAEGPFIERHVKALSAHCHNEAWHIGVQPARGPWRYTRKSLRADRTFAAEVRTHRWLLIEWATWLLVAWAWATRRKRGPFDVVVLHIAYPLGTRLRSLEKMFGVPVVLAEQWSAYHYSFHANGKGLRRIRDIFGHGAPLTCVSHSLLKDIEAFSGKPQQHAMVIDNVAETSVFHYHPGSRPEEGRFFAVASWRTPKRPMALIGMMARLRDAGIRAELRLAGGGPKTEEMSRAVEELGLGDRVTLLGRLSPEAVAREMRAAHAVLHASDYETYSAVCAEALCCGTPVLASNVGGISEYVPAMDGSHLVDDNEPETWERALLAAWESLLNADRRATSEKMAARASTASVGARFHAFLRAVADRRYEIQAARPASFSDRSVLQQGQV